MILKNVTIELSGITRIVVDQTTVYIRKENHDWINTNNGKTIPDHLMMRRVKKMLKESIEIIGDVVDVDYRSIKMRILSNRGVGWLPKYRPWVNMETLNIERVIY